METRSDQLNISAHSNPFPGEIEMRCIKFCGKVDDSF